MSDSGRYSQGFFISVVVDIFVVFLVVNFSGIYSGGIFRHVIVVVIRYRII